MYEVLTIAGAIAFVTTQVILYQTVKILALEIRRLREIKA